MQIKSLLQYIGEEDVVIRHQTSLVSVSARGNIHRLSGGCLGDIYYQSAKEKNLIYKKRQEAPAVFYTISACSKSPINRTSRLRTRRPRVKTPQGKSDLLFTEEMSSGPAESVVFFRSGILT